MEAPPCLADWGFLSAAVLVCLFVATSLLKRQAVRGLWPFRKETPEWTLLLPIVVLLVLAQAAETSAVAGVLQRRRVPMQQLVLHCCCGLLAGQATQGTWLFAAGTGFAAAAAAAHLRAVTAANGAAAAAATPWSAAETAGHLAAETEAAAGNSLLLLQLLLLASYTCRLGGNKQLQPRWQQQQELRASAMTGVAIATALVGCMYTRICADIAWGWPVVETTCHVCLLLLPVARFSRRFLRLSRCCFRTRNSS